MASLIEAFVQQEAWQAAYEVFRQAKWRAVVEKPLYPQSSYCNSDVLIIGNRIASCPASASHDAYANLNSAHITKLQSSDELRYGWRRQLCQQNIVDETGVSLKRSVVMDFASRFGVAGYKDCQLSLTQFHEATLTMAGNGLLTVPIGKVDFGALRRAIPFCPDYGFTRGTPIDRYYLMQFIRRFRSLICGRTLEIGGRRENWLRYGLDSVTDYTTVDIEPASGVDVIADAHDPRVFSKSTFDSVIMFNLNYAHTPVI
jgi:hypothetical protein